MKRYLRWVLISSCLSGCCISDSKNETGTLQQLQLPVLQTEQIKEIDYLGWVEIEGTLSQGFVQGKDNQEYLYRNADGTESLAGANFLDWRCTFESDNLIIYGHSSRTSQILFTPLMNYLDEDYALSHDEIVLNYNDEINTYELMSVFLFHVNSSSDNDWMNVHFEREFLFHKAVERLKKRSLHDFNTSGGSQLLTLVTCNTENHDERLIVVGIRSR